jgi:hypothetical protein
MRSYDRAFPIATFTVLAASALASADIIQLKPTGKLEGEIVGEKDDKYVIKLASGGTTTVPKRYVKSVEKTSPRSAGPARAVDKTATPEARRSTARPDDAPDEWDVSGKTSSGADDEGRVPPYARLGTDAKPVDAGRVPPDFKAEVDEWLRTGPTPDAVVEWAKARPRSPDELVYLTYLLQTFKGDDRVLKALWKGFAERDPATAEARLLPFVTSDLWTPRMESCTALRPYATWRASLAPTLRLLGKVHMNTMDSARLVLEALIEREPPTSETVKTFIELHAKARPGKQRWQLAHILAACAKAGSPDAVRCLREAFESSKDPQERMDLVEPVIRGLDRSEAHALLIRTIGEAPSRPESKVLLGAAIRELPEHGGEFGDIPLLVSVLRVKGDGESMGHGRLGVQEAQTAVLNVVPLLARRSFRDAEELEQWWESIREVWESLPALLSDISSRGAGAVAAVQKVVRIPTLEVTRALRDAAANHPEAEVRAEACVAIGVRADRGGAPAVLTALQRSDGATRPRVLDGLGRLARGQIVPQDVSAVESWWRSRFPEDFAETDADRDKM